MSTKENWDKLRDQLRAVMFAKPKFDEHDDPNNIHGTTRQAYAEGRRAGLDAALFLMSELESEPPKEAIQQARDAYDGKGMFCAMCEQYVERGKIHKCKEPERVVIMSEVRDIVREELRAARIEFDTRHSDVPNWLPRYDLRIVPAEQTESQASPAAKKPVQD